MTTGLSADISPDDHGPTAAEAGSRLTAFASPRRTLLGTGTAARIEIPAPWPDHLDRVVEHLASIPHDPDAPLRPTAFGALPFDRGRPAAFVVPTDLHGRTAEGERWVLRLKDPERSERPDRSTATVREPVEPAEPTEVTVRALQSPQDWCAAVASARERIRRGELVKVVLARGVEITGDRPFDAAALWNRLAAAHGEAAYVFAVDGFVGASPELLVSRIGATVRAQPMAGTTPRSGHPETDQRRATELLTSAKNLEEHQITIDAVHDTLLPWCSYLDAEPTPSVVAAGPVQHLATLVEGRLSSPEPTVVELVAALHPTPAVGGSPTASALALQATLEPFDRGRYAGPVGWVDSARRRRVRRRHPSRRAAAHRGVAVHRCRRRRPTPIRPPSWRRPGPRPRRCSAC